MLVANPQPSIFHTSQQRQQLPTQHLYYPSTVDIDIDLDIASANVSRDHSVSSSPQATQAVLWQYSALEGAGLSEIENIPAVYAPRGSGRETFFSLPASSVFEDSSMVNFIQPDSSWLARGGQFAPQARNRMSHHRESSLSSLGSTGPASPLSQNTSNPQIAVTESVGDGYGGLPYYDDSSYHLAKTLSPTNHDAFYGNHASFSPESTSATAFSRLGVAQGRRNDRSLLPPPDLSVGSNRSRPVSVASSVASDSPATPSLEQPDDDRRTKHAFVTIPKLDRTMTDIYSDELYSPNFVVTSESPSQVAQIPLSPSHDMFAQRLKTISSQHLSATNSPASSASRGKSPFRHGSPLAPPGAGREFAGGMAPAQLAFGSAQQLREQRKAEQDAQTLRQQMVRNSDLGTPQTISPKDAILDFHDVGGEANFPLFPPQNSSRFEASRIPKITAASGQPIDAAPVEGTAFNFLATPVPVSLQQVPQQHPFMVDAGQKSGGTPMKISSRLSSARGSSSDSSADSHFSRPSGPLSGGGTYTCTYHGCTLRFETQALLQKHKREGHRQAHGLNGTRRAEGAGSGMTSSLMNSQAGPHRCDRINPSTGKPCDAIFSRPYDLTRHEDTIHNARKQKVRCDMCTEEKTFSRADALTRHYRVCHPDVEVHGKHRRRGGHSA